MKKYIFSFVFLLPVSVALGATADSGYCLQRQQAALSPRGDECKVYDSPCNIPEGWKPVPRCDMVEDPNFGSRPEDVSARRSTGFYKTLNQIKRAQNQDVYYYQRTRVGGGVLRPGRAADTRPDVHEASASRSNADVPTSAIRGRTMPKYGSKNAYNLYKSLNPSKGGYEHEDDPDKEERTYRRQSSFRARLGSGSGAIREGSLSSDPLWSEAQKQHYNESVSETQNFRSRVDRTRRVDRSPIQRELKLKKVYRESRVGNLDTSESLDMDAHRKAVEELRQSQ